MLTPGALSCPKVLELADSVPGSFRARWRGCCRDCFRFLAMNPGAWSRAASSA